MADETVPETRKISVTFERKLGSGDFGNSVCRAWVEDNVPANATDSQIADALNGLFTAVKASVFDQLGIEFVVDEHGVMREKHAPVATEQVAGRLGGGTTSLKVMNADKQDGPIPEAVLAACAEKGITAVWDNRKQGKGFKEGIKRGEVSKVTGTSNGAFISVDGTITS